MCDSKNARATCQKLQTAEKMAPLKKSRGVSSGYRYRTIGRVGTYKRVAYKKKSPKVTLFQEVKKSAEWKNIDNQIETQIPVSSNGFSGPQILNPLLQGTSAVTRIGRKVTFRSLTYRIQFSGATGASANTSPLRVLIVYDRQPNGVAAAASDVLEQATFTGHMNLARSDRFLIMSDKIHESSSTGPSTGKCHIKMSLESFYSTNLGTIADIQTGAILMFLASTGSTSTTFNTVVRLRFTDS